MGLRAGCDGREGRGLLKTAWRKERGGAAVRGKVGGEAHLAREEKEEEEKEEEEEEVPRPTREESELRMEAAAEEDLRERRPRGEKMKMGEEADGD